MLLQGESSKISKNARKEINEEEDNPPKHSLYLKKFITELLGKRREREMLLMSKP